jgi:hypothetical protein
MNAWHTRVRTIEADTTPDHYGIAIEVTNNRLRIKQWHIVLGAARIYTSTSESMIRLIWNAARSKPFRAAVEYIEALRAPLGHR